MSTWKKVLVAGDNASTQQIIVSEEALVATDHIVFADQSDNQVIKRDTIVDFANLIAGDALDTDDDGVIDLSVAGLSANDEAALSDDLVLVWDASASTWTTLDINTISTAGTGDISSVVITAGDGNTVGSASGSADFTISDGEGIDTSVSAGNLVIAAEVATSSNLGVASFGADFTVASGAVSLAENTISGVTLGNDLGTLSATSAGGISVTSYNGSASVNNLELAIDDMAVGPQAPTGTDLFAIYDNSASAHKSVTLSAIADYVSGDLTNDSTFVGTTELTLGDVSGSNSSLAGLTGLDFTTASASIAASIGSNTLTIGGSGTTVNIAGNLQVTGTLETVTETELQVLDKNITLAQGSSTAAAATGGGIIIDVSTDANYSEDPAILFRADSNAAAFSEFEMVKGKTAGGDNAFIAGMVEAASTAALDLLDPGVGSFGFVAGALYIQTS